MPPTWLYLKIDITNPLQMDFIGAYATNPKPIAKQENNTTLKALQQAEERYNALHQEYARLRDQHEKLSKHASTLSETLKVVGSQSTSKAEQKLLQTQLQMEQTYKLDLSAKHSKLQEQYKALKDTVETLSRSYESADEKLLLQKQMNENKLRTIEATHNTLKERCKSMAISSEQHRLANLQLEVRNKSMTKDVENLAAALKSNIETHHKELGRLKSEYTGKIQSKDSEISSLNLKIDSHTVEAKRLQSKIQAAERLLKAHPVDPCQNAKTKSILESSAEILEIAHTNGGVESMHQCLCQVAEVLKDLNGQLGSQRRLASAWMEQVSAI